MSETNVNEQHPGTAGETPLKCPFSHKPAPAGDTSANTAAPLPPVPSGCPVQHESAVVIAPTNPSRPSLFDTEMAIANSCYLAIPHPDVHELGKRNQTAHIVPAGKLWPTDEDPRPTRKQRMIHDEMLQHIGHKAFPCTGAHIVVNGATHRIGVYGTMASIEATAGMGRDLRRFVAEQKQFGDAPHLKFTAFIAIFEEPRPTSETQFEELLWKQLQMLHDHDEATWDPEYSSDPTNPQWAYSFGGRSFFIVGFNPQASRTSRTFSRCAVMFNAEYQVAALRERGDLPKWFNNIRNADRELDGSINPTIAQLADNSYAHTEPEGAIYSGKSNNLKEWKCPFAARPDVVDPKKS